MALHFVGADGCKGGWIAAERAEDAIECRRVERIEELFTGGRLPDIVAVDAPIGLPDCGARLCDVATRELLGRRANSVFAAPIRPLLRASSFAEACRMREAVENKRISLQTWSIIPKIAELDALLRSHPVARATIREVHPELCFAKMNGDCPLAASKRKPEGRDQRIALLDSWCGDAVRRALAQRRVLGCAVDDVLDAFAALWTAERIARGQAVSIPDPPALDACGLPMAITA
jgi:predicted RNase H-like nuclease